MSVEITEAMRLAMQRAMCCGTHCHVEPGQFAVCQAHTWTEEADAALAAVAPMIESACKPKWLPITDKQKDGRRYFITGCIDGVYWQAILHWASLAACWVDDHGGYLRNAAYYQPLPPAPEPKP